MVLRTGPKLVRAAVQASDDTIWVVLLLPTTASLPNVGGGATVAVETQYPFGDDVDVRVKATKRVKLSLRVPAWATRATVSIGQAAPRAVAADAYFTLQCEAGETAVTLALNPEIRVERGWGPPGTDAVAVLRGPLLFALPLDEKVTALHKPWACFESGCSVDYKVTSSGSWAYALVLPSNDTTANMRFQRLAPPGKHPFAGLKSPTVEVQVQARQLKSWKMHPQHPKSPGPVPPSPVCGSEAAGDCGPVETVSLVPFGSTRLRIAMFPSTPSAARLKADDNAGVKLSFSPPQVVSAPIECYDAAQKRPCGYLQSGSCRCPELPAAADSFYGLDANASHMMGVYNEHVKGTTELTYTTDGRSWRRKNFSGTVDAFAWSTYAVDDGKARRTFGGISLGGFRNRSLGSMTDRSWTGRQSATYFFDSAGELQAQPSGQVTVGPLPHAVDNTNGVASVK